MSNKPTITDPYFDLTEQFESEIEPLIRELHKRCSDHDIPFVIGVCYGAKDEGRSNGYKVLCAGVNAGARTPATLKIATSVIKGEAKEALDGIMHLMGKCQCNHADTAPTASETIH